MNKLVVSLAVAVLVVVASVAVIGWVLQPVAPHNPVDVAFVRAVSVLVGGFFGIITHGGNW